MSLCCGLFRRQPARRSAPARNAQGQQQGQQHDLDDVEFTPRTSFASSYNEESNEEITTTRQHAVAGNSAPVVAPRPPQPSIMNPELAGYYSPAAPRAPRTPAPPPRPQPSYRPPQELSGFYSPSSSAAAQSSGQASAPRQAPLANRARNPKPTTYN